MASVAKTAPPDLTGLSTAKRILAEIGLNLNPASYLQPYASGAAQAIGSGLSAFGRTQALEATLSKNKALEAKLGVPVDFFKSLSPAAQKQVLERAGLGPADLQSQPLPAFGGKTVADLIATGAPSPTVDTSGTGAFSDVTGTVETGPPFPPGLKPGTKQWAEAMNRTLGIEDILSPLEAARAGQARSAADLNRTRIKMLESGKTVSGGTPGGKDPIDVIVAKAIAKANGDPTTWPNELVKVRSNQYKYVRTGSKMLTVYNPDGSVATNVTYDFGQPGVAPLASHPDPKSLASPKHQAAAAQILSSSDPAALQRSLDALAPVNEPLRPFLLYRLSQLKK